MRRHFAVALLLAVVFGLWPQGRLTAQQDAALPSAVAKPSLTADEVASRLAERNAERAQELRGFEGTRVYHIQYQGPFGERNADMAVKVVYKSPDDKEFTVESQSGSKFLFDHVLKGLLDGEKEASTPANQKRTALTKENYNFTLAVYENSPSGGQYVLNVTPKTDYKYLYRGKIWVDAQDFAVTRIEAEPSKSPSFWVKKSEVKHRYEKVGDFWLPATNRTESWIRLGGEALLSIDYENYEITGQVEAGPGGKASDAVASRIAEMAARSN
jgi:hypothetical protein